MKINILTLFPEMFDIFNHSIIGKAQEKQILSIEPINIRDFTLNKHRKVDDYPYGGGAGMVMAPQPIYDAYLSLIDGDKKPRTIYMSPKGQPFNQQKALELSCEEHIVLLCGHYEGVDQRVLDKIVDEEISLGDFVLTGGEIAAIAVTDAVT